MVKRLRFSLILLDRLALTLKLIASDSEKFSSFHCLNSSKQFEQAFEVDYIENFYKWHIWSHTKNSIGTRFKIQGFWFGPRFTNTHQRQHCNHKLDSIFVRNEQLRAPNWYTRRTKYFFNRTRNRNRHFKGLFRSLADTHWLWIEHCFWFWAWVQLHLQWQPKIYAVTIWNENCHQKNFPKTTMVATNSTVVLKKNTMDQSMH